MPCPYAKIGAPSAAAVGGINTLNCANHIRPRPMGEGDRRRRSGEGTSEAPYSPEHSPLKKPIA
jgi:hypothetical protein